MRPLHLSLVLGIALAAACGDPFGLPSARTDNVVDTVSLYALSGTPIATPSGYSLQFREAVRIDQGGAFDFAFEIDSAGRALLLATGPLDLGRNSGVQLSNQPFDSIRIAPTSNYQLDSAVVVTDTSVAIVQSQLAVCSWGGQAFYYAKLQVLEIAFAERWLKFQILVDTNCGYRGLEPGLPSR